MHIKENPISKNNEFAGFELDASKVELHSSHERNIHLPYSGLLPDALQKNDGAFLTIGISVGLTVGVSLVVKIGKKEHRFPIEVTSKEINDLLFPFFFRDMGNNKYHTRFENGLNAYWEGNFQSSYTHWRRLVVEGHGIDNVIDQLSPEALNCVIWYINEHKRTA